MVPEEIIEPGLPIIDPHHHLWDLRPILQSIPEPHHPFIAAIAGADYYTFDALHADTHSGHNVLATVYMECGAFYDASRSEAMKVVGEVEFVNGVAAQGASGLYGAYRPCAGIVGHADLTLGQAVAPVIEALIAAGNGRFRGIRHVGAWDADPDVLGPPFHAPQGLFGSETFRAGIDALGDFDLPFDAWVLEPQLPDVVALARAFPDQTIILDHCGTPLNIACYHGTLPAQFERWRGNIRELSKCANVYVKLGGLGMPFCGMPEKGPAEGMGSAQLVDLWRPYIETCIECFGSDRAMFESNYPVDRWGAGYREIWNTFKRITAGASQNEKRSLYAGTAAHVYDLGHFLPSDGLDKPDG